ncbi:MAG TPA: histidine kinase dimerization/phosphoacceptor domain -containing protein [Puia sp.]|nr:histidine kinase dimerization/phosphoacceptor domain -containing protein [Puia sp.]
MKNVLLYFIFWLPVLSLQTRAQDISSAEAPFRARIREATRANNPYLVGKAYYDMARLFAEQKNHNRAFGALFNARQYFTQAGAKKEIAYTLFGLGREQYYRGNYKIAAEHLNFAMREAETMKLIDLESDALEYLGILYHVMPGANTESIAQFKKALEIKEELNDRKGMLRMQEKLAEAYYEQEHYDSALTSLDQAISLATSLQLIHDADISRLDRAGTLIYLHKLDDAKKDIDHIAQHGDTSDLNIGIRYFTQLGNLMVAQHDLTRADGYYRRALKVADRIGVPEMYGLVYRNMAGMYSSIGMYKEAYTFIRQYNEQMMGYYAENVSAIKDLEYIFNNSLTRDEVTLLSSENKQKGLFALIFLLLAAIIFYLYRQQKKKARLIRRQADELKTLMKEIHHRVKNNLQIISSLLDLQSMMVKDDQASRAIKEGRNRVQSMALIHQNLYGDTDAIAIAVDEYIDSLAQNLFSSYNIRQDQIELKTHIEKMKLDIDTVIPIGLMLNELISNSLKHAFEKGKYGCIELTLKKEKDVLLMQVKDNGKGFPEPVNPDRPAAFGMRMIKIFAQKLKADLNIYNDQGACVAMRMRKYRLIEK